MALLCLSETYRSGAGTPLNRMRVSERVVANLPSSASRSDAEAAGIAEGDLVVTRLRGIGKHQGEIFGVPPSGNDLDVKAIAIHRVENGQLVEHWSAMDTAALLQQLGAIKLPPPPKQTNPQGRMP